MGLLEPGKEQMESIPSISIDYAVMEKSSLASVVSCDIGWTDLGSFDSLFPVAFEPKVGNSVLTEEEPLFIDSKDNLVIGRGKKKIVLIDVEDTAVVDTEDALLVMRRGSGQRVKEAVDALKRENSALLDAHTTVNRPWGSYTLLLDTERVKVRRLTILPGKGISLHSHKYRQEHWVCVDGMGAALLNGAEKALSRDQEAFVQAGDLHSLACVGDQPVTVIETQIGEYFGDDDILRVGEVAGPR
jgi:mannose-1-phosphate guanylyltransferase